MARPGTPGRGLDDAACETFDHRGMVCPSAARPDRPSFFDLANREKGRHPAVFHVYHVVQAIPMTVQTHYYCPQCGYDLSGQKLERCPECCFHYDIPALQDLLGCAFNAACDPYISGTRFLARACVLAVASLASSYWPAALALTLLFILSPTLVESWLHSSRRRDLSSIQAFELSFLRVYGWGLWFLFILVIIHFPIAVWLACGCLLIGLAWTTLSLSRHTDMIRNNRVRSLDPQHLALLNRARTTAWSLAFIDMVLLAFLISRL